MQDFPVGVSHALLTWIWRLWRYPCFGRLNMGCFGYNFVKSCEISVLSVVCPVLSPVFIRKYQDFVIFCLPLYCILLICSWCLAYDARAPIVVSFFHGRMKIPIPEGEVWIFWWKKCTTTEKKHIKQKLKRDFMANMPFRISILCIFPTHPINKVRPQPRISSIHWMSPAGELWSALRKLPVMLPREAEMRGCLV